MATPITHRTLCAIARAVIEEERLISDAEWKERIKCRLVAQGWAYPTPTMLEAALAAVERALVKLWGPRPVDPPPPPPAPQRPAGASSPPSASPWRVPRDRVNSTGWTKIADVLAPVASTPRPTLQEQIDAYRSSEPRPQMIQTAKGWERVRTSPTSRPRREDAPHDAPDDNDSDAASRDVRARDKRCVPS